MNIVKTILLFLILSSCKNEKSKDVILKSSGENEIETKLIAVKSNNSVDFLHQITVQKIITEFGKPIKIEKEKENDSESAELWTSLYYDGLEIVLEGNFIAEITISNKEWKIDDFKVGDKENLVRLKLKASEKKDNNYNLYLFPKLEGLFFCKTNKEGKLIQLGITNYNF